jgi:hypothetical protein
MDELQPQVNIPEKPRSKWLDKPHIIAYGVVFLGLAATAGAVYYSQNQKLPDLNTQQPIVHQPKTAPASDWETYVNTDYGFELKYPAGWGDIAYVPGGGVELHNIFVDLMKGTTIDKFFKQQIKTTVISKNTVNVEGIKWIELTTQDDVGKGLYYGKYLERSGNVIGFSGEANGTNKALIDQIISYVKLSFDVSPITTWKTYTNTKYGFEVQIPKDWTVDDAMVKDGVCFISPSTGVQMKGEGWEGLCGDVFFEPHSYQSEANPGSLGKIQINNQSFTYYLGGPGYDFDHVEKNNQGKIYDFYGYNNLYGILSTFKLISASACPDKPLCDPIPPLK